MFTIGFLVSLGLTVVLIALTLQSGIGGRRRAHLARALTTVGLLAVTVVFAFLMAEYERLFVPEKMRVHRMFSMTVAFVVPAVALTGAMLWKRPGWRWPHKICIGVFLLAALGAAVTGVWVLWTSTAK